MLLCGINDAKPGMVLGAVVTDPRTPQHDLLRPGVRLDERLIASLRARAVTHIWLEDDLTRDLDHAVAARLTGARVAVYTRMRDGLAACARGTITVASVQEYRRAVLGLVTEAIGSATYASMTDALFGVSDQSSHATNVAYLALLTGLHLEAYVVAEQKRLEREEAREMSVLGLAGLLHDIGKTQLSPAAGAFHDVHADETGGGHARPDGYLQHVTVGKRLLENSRVPARVAHTVLNHHQRFDGKGWPDLTKITGGRLKGPLGGRRIHIFARIVAAANVLDNLLRGFDGLAKPPVAALQAFASDRFDGWFDPMVRRAMLLRIPPFAIGSDVRLSDGGRGVVVAPNPQDPCRPAVRIREEGGPGASAEAASVQLGAQRGLSITHCLGVDVRSYLFEPPAAAWPDGVDEGAAASTDEADLDIDEESGSSGAGE